jgi:hypothetical protein
MARRKKRAKWGSKTRNGHAVKETQAPTLVPTLEAVPLKEVLEEFHLKTIHDLAEQGAMLTFITPQPQD